MLAAMRILTKTRIGLAATLVVGATLFLPAAAPAAPAAPAHHRPATFTVRGDVAHQLTLTADQLRRYGNHRQHVWFTSGSGAEQHTFTGPLLLDVLTAAAPKFDPAVHNDALGFVIVVTGTDGYRVAVSWGEFDPGFAGNQVQLAYQQDDATLERPRLVVPEDTKGGRYVSDVASVTVIGLG